MKKYVLMIALAITSMFAFNLDANAEDVKLCTYYHDVEGTKVLGMQATGYSVWVTLYYDAETNGYKAEFDEYPTGGLSYIGHGGEEHRIVSLYDNQYVKMSTPAETSLKNGSCPENLYYDPDGNASICMDDHPTPSEGWCRTRKESYPASELTKLQFDEYKSFEVGLVIDGRSITFDDVSCDDASVSESMAMSIINNKINVLIQESAKHLPEGYIDRIYESTKEKYSKTIYDNGWKNFVSACEAEYQQQVNNGTMTTEEKKEKMENLNVSLEQVKSSLSYDYVVDLFDRNYTGVLYCGFIGENTFGYIQMIYGMIKFIIPAVIVLLGMVDFMKVLLSGDEKDMKASGVKFLKRIAAGLIFILLPVLVEFIIRLVGFSEDCIQQLIK